MYKCVSSTPAGSIEGYARVHVLGMLTSTTHLPLVGSSFAWQGAGVIPLTSSASCGWGGLTAHLSLAEKLKFTPPPQPLQCMEFDKEVTVSCSATGREKPTIQWTKTGKGDVVAICLFLMQRGCGCLGSCHVTQCFMHDCCISLLASYRWEQPAIPCQPQCWHLVLPQGEQE